MNYEKPTGEKESGGQAAAIALALSGLLTLTIQFLMAPTHTIGGINYADAWHTALTAIGAGLILAAILHAVRLERLRLRQQQQQVAATR